MGSASGIAALISLDDNDNIQPIPLPGAFKHGGINNYLIIIIIN